MPASPAPDPLTFSPSLLGEPGLPPLIQQPSYVSVVCAHSHSESLRSPNERHQLGPLLSSFLLFTDTGAVLRFLSDVFFSRSKTMMVVRQSSFERAAPRHLIGATDRRCNPLAISSQRHNKQRNIILMSGNGRLKESEFKKICGGGCFNRPQVCGGGTRVGSCIHLLLYERE